MTVFALYKVAEVLWFCLPITAPSATSEPIHDASSSVGTALRGVSERCTSFSFGPTGAVHPRVVPTAILDRFTKRE